MKFALPENIKKFLTRDKLILIFLFGILLIVINLPVKSQSNKKSNTESETIKTEEYRQTDANTYKKSLEKELEEILSKTEGVGKVNVFITLKASAQSNLYIQREKIENTMTQKDLASGDKISKEYEEKESVVYTDNGKSPYVISFDMPKIQGILIIAEGGGDISTVSKITNAASALFGITVNRIKVLKMEG